MSDVKKILNMTETAQYLGIPKRTAYYMLKKQRFPVKPLPRTAPPKWSVADLENWLTTNSGVAGAK